MDTTTTQTQPLAFTINEAIELSRVGRTSLRLAMKSGSLPARKRGKTVLILRSDLERWLQDLPPVYSPQPAPKRPQVVK